jgi:alanine racemase
MFDPKDANSQPQELRRERGTTAYINTSNINHNLKVFKQLHAGKIIAVVKADAYGHGLKHVVNALPDCDAFAVATIEEALELRTLETNKKIILLEGVFNDYEMNTAFENQLDVVIHQDYQIKLLASAEPITGMNVWLKVDSGMHRLGFGINEVEQRLVQLNKIASIDTVRLMSHFAASDLIDCEQTLDQINTNSWLKSLGYEYSFSNTGGVLNHLADRDEWARVGIGLFGVSPLTAGQWGSDFGLKPAMHLTAKIIASKYIKAGAQVGYGGHFSAETDMRIGIVGIGYADGYPWSERSSYVMLDGKKAAVIGRVSMDMIAIDLSNFKTQLTGKEVTIWGGQLPIEQIAEDLKLIPYTLACGITKRVKFHAIQ